MLERPPAGVVSANWSYLGRVARGLIPGHKV
jgi:hypothetical protein